MNPFAMGGVPNVPTTEELWKDEKSKFRVWIILFTISIIAIFALSLTSIILNATGRGSIIEITKKWFEHNGTFKKDANIPLESLNIAERSWRNSMIINGIKIGLLAIGVVLFFSTVIDSYRHHTFEKLSKFATYIVGLSAFMGVYQLFSLIWSKSPQFEYTEGIIEFVSWLIPVIIWVFVSLPINKIRRQFQVSSAVEKIKADPRYQEMIKAQQTGQGPFANGGMGPMGPMGPMPQPGFTPQQPQSPMAGGFKPNPVNAPDLNQARELTPEEKRELDLRTMTIRELRKVAKQLSISGYDEMNKSELVEAIMRVS